jgi:hypothetical protein
MNLQEYTKAVSPGNRVYVLVHGQKVYAIAGNLWGEDGPEPVIRFDGGQTAAVTEKNVHLIFLEPLN